jgi:hypothetical protein
MNMYRTIRYDTSSFQVIDQRCELVVSIIKSTTVLWMRTLNHWEGW